MAGALEQWGWAWVRAIFPSFVASRETPNTRVPRTCRRWSPEGLASSSSHASLPLSIAVVRESSLFSVGCGEHCSEIIGLQLFGAQL